jgi:hypothetical protein
VRETRRPGRAIAMDPPEVSTKETRSLTEVDFPVAFEEDGEVVVNFGTLTGREATQAEIDRLAQALHRAGFGPGLTITAARRQEYADGVETVVHQVHVSAENGNTRRAQAICHDWALGCAEDRSVQPLP